MSDFARYPRTLAELAVSTAPTPVGVLRTAAGLAAQMNDHEIWAEMFRTVADDADTELGWTETPGDRKRVYGGALDYVWVHYGGSCGPIDECSCALGAVLKAALAFLNVEIDGGWTPPLDGAR